MRFKRLRIKNYRGVEDAAIEFTERGITLVQGPNEAGKTSLATSVDILFRHKATANHKDVREIRPVHRDANPEIELEAESGDCHFVYHKVFQPRGGTATLEVSGPSPGNYTADTAHDRANRILEDTLDKHLWDALIVRQGDAVGIPDLRGKAGLMSALDAAGGGGRDVRSEGIFELVRAEYAAYYGKDGEERGAFARLGREAADASAHVDEIEAALEDLDRKIERSAALKKSLADLERRLGETARDRERHRAQAEAIDVLTAALNADRAGLAAAEARVAAAARDMEERKRLVAVETAAGAELSRAAAELDAALPRAAEVEAGLAGLTDALARAGETKRAADEAVSLARADRDYCNDLLHLELMRERRGGLEQARTAAEEAGRELGRNPVTDEMVAAIRGAEIEAAKLAARAEAEAARINLTALADADAVVDGAAVSLAEGESREYAASGPMRIVAGERLEIRIDPGRRSGDLMAKLAAAREALADLCRRAGVADATGAFEAHERRRLAERALREQETLERAALRDLTPEDFYRRLAGLESAVADYPPRRRADSPIPGNLDVARIVLEEAEKAAAEADAAWQSAAAGHNAVRTEHESLARRTGDLRIRRDIAAKNLEQASAELAAARGTAGDDILADALASAESALASATDKVRHGEESLAGHNPERVRAMLATLTGTLESLRRRQAETKLELTALGTELRMRGEEGLFDELGAARNQREKLRSALARERARAAAAKTLFDIMRECRDRARGEYLAPLKDKIEELGRWVFDPSFSVAMNSENLGVDSRTLRGVTVPFDSLSGGAREQISLIYRAACSILVSENGGMPLILDDALGYTDPERLPVMGAVLARAAEQCQIVIFTCVPERYANIGDAKVVQL